jgi:catecholate siderophore receptor
MRSSSSDGVRAFARSARFGIGAASAASALMASPALAADAVEGMDGVIATGAAELPTLYVTGERRIDRSADPRIGPVLDAPQSITIIPRQVIQQRGATTLRDILRNVPGISMQAGEGGVPAGDQLSIRGFSARTDIFVDGVRDTGAYTRDPFDIERVEVLKGPSSAYVGRGSTGGAINQVSKQPENERFVAGTMSLGAPWFGRASIDLGQPFAAGALGEGAFRLNAVYQDADAPGRDHVWFRRWGVAPTFGLGLDGPTRLSLGYLHLHQDGLPDYGVPFVPATNNALAAYRDRPAPVDFSNFYGLINRDFETTNTDAATLTVAHDFSDKVSVTNTLRYTRTHRDSVIAAPRFVGDNSTDVIAEYKARDQVDAMLIDQLSLQAKFATGPIGHAVTAGVEVSRETGENLHRTAPNSTPTDLFDPDPFRQWTGPVTVAGTFSDRGDMLAGYAFDLVTLTPHWELAGGLRWERYDTDYTPAAGAKLSRSDETLSWKAGVIYKPVADASIYFGYGTSVNPSIDSINLASTNLPALIDPEKSRSFELGAKWRMLDDRLLLTAAVFRTEKTNARTPGLPGDPPTVLAGDQRVDGLEISATGQITEAWYVLAGYTLLDSEIVRSNTPAEVGNDMPQTPAHSFSLWTTYRIDRALGGLGAQFVSDRFTNAANTRVAPAYWTFDAMASYDLTKNLIARVNLYNIADKRYVDAVSGGHFIPGMGRAVMMSLDFRY